MLKFSFKLEADDLVDGLVSLLIARKRVSLSVFVPPMELDMILSIGLRLNGNFDIECELQVEANARVL